MTTRPLDPWDDALAIAARLQSHGAVLTVVLGAEAWCDKCRRLRPLFDALQAVQFAPVPPATPAATVLWLDLEEHAEFIGRFVPDDLPLLLRWQAGLCVQAAVVLEAGPQLADGWLLQDCPVPADVPDLWAGFARGEWASG